MVWHIIFRVLITLLPLPRSFDQDYRAPYTFRQRLCLINSVALFHFAWHVKEYGVQTKILHLDPI